MAVGRKSSVAAKGNWFGRITQPSGKSPSAGFESASRNGSIPMSSRRQRRSNTNKTVTPAPGQLGKQKLPKQNGSSATPKSPKGNQERVPVMPNSESPPLWLLRLHTIHRNSSIAAFLLVAATLVVYGWTVYSQELWSQAYQKLQNLQRQDRQLTTTNEVLQNKMAVEGEKPSTGLVAPTPARAIFINPASHNFNSMPSVGDVGRSPTTMPNSQTQQQSAPGLGY
ncbi:hypothetical protein H6G81_16680 [Scytonema hofmannii FACHB-248]|uniref:Cell division protein FtsL n=1 Tax=Scytonema hofmannii FACHB-248 TaxID=1842502 RepID=A0ABR8GRS8_9CYAN|nr:MULTISPECIES: hypothetical protein [Nostocales]MBD2606116.1 hypothetical protein [Scytonema hofmannii FACHB-248]